jgi:putative transposase
LSVRRQGELVGLNRSTLYYEPAPETPENLGRMRLIDGTRPVNHVHDSGLS